MDMPSTSSGDITALAASCFPLARIAVTGIAQDVVKLVPADPRRKAEALAVLLQEGALFQDGILEMLHELICALDDEIARSSRVVECYDHSPENVSDNTSWQELQTTRKADRLNDALATILERYASLMAVRDLLRAEQALKTLRAC